MNEIAVKITSYVPPSPTRYTLNIEGLRWDELQALKMHCASAYQQSLASDESAIKAILYKLWNAKTP